MIVREIGLRALLNSWAIVPTLWPRSGLSNKDLFSPKAWVSILFVLKWMLR